MRNKRRKQQTVRFLHRTLLFFVSLSYAIALFFVFGNIQNFLDSTQMLLLSLLGITALVTAILSIPLMALEIFFFFFHRRLFYLSLAGMALLCFLSGLILSGSAHVVLLAAKGF
jgi:heme A synthase